MGLEEAARVVEVGEVPHLRRDLALPETRHHGRHGDGAAVARREVQPLRRVQCLQGQMLRQLGEERLQLRHQQRAAGDGDDLVGSPGVVADQHRAGQRIDRGVDLGAQAVVPGLAGDQLGIVRHRDLPDVLQGLLHRSGLEQHLGEVVEVLEVADAGAGELRHGIGPPRRPRLQDLHDLRPAVVRPPLHDARFQQIAGSRAGNEDRNAFPAAQTVAASHQLLHPQIELVDAGQLRTERHPRRRGRLMGDRHSRRRSRRLEDPLRAVEIPRGPRWTARVAPRAAGPGPGCPGTSTRPGRTSVAVARTERTVGAGRPRGTWRTAGTGRARSRTAGTRRPTRGTARTFRSSADARAATAAGSSRWAAGSPSAWGPSRSRRSSLSSSHPAVPSTRI